MTSGTTGQDYDVVVVGAGIAGLCCAATLVNRGLNTLLVAETPEVAWNVRAVDVQGNKGYVQHPMWSVAWGGGSWYRVAREIGANVTFHVAPPVDLTVMGSGVVHEVPICTSAAAMTDLFEKMSPIPLDDMRPEFERVIGAALAIPYQDLIAMDQVPISQWLEEQGANPILQLLVMTFAANVCETTVQIATEHLSVFGVWGMVRGLICGESPVVCPDPDPAEGVGIPIGRAIEKRGGTVWRGRKVRRVLIENGVATGIEMEDGTTATARAVALSCGTSRVPKILGTIHPEVQAAIDHGQALAGEDVCTYTLLNEPVVDIKSYTMVSDQAGSNLAFLFPMHHLSPGHTTPGKQFLAAQGFYTPQQYADIGERDGAVKRLNEICEDLFPGFTAATEVQTTQRHRHHWIGPLMHGPRLPSRDPEIAGLWFSGDGSRPVAGLGVEAAASAGLLRAHSIADSLV
jgi:predicted NAD/FAD-dependent oxidoreductase